MSTKDIVLIGSRGQLGREIASRFQNSSWKLLKFTKEDLDISSFEKVKEVFSSINPLLVINAAAYTDVEKAELSLQDAMSVNAIGPKNLATICNKLDIPLIHFSTDYVFDGSKKKPYSELDKTNPINNYGISKLQGENEIRKYAKKFIIIRTSWIFSEYGKNFVKTVLNLSRELDEIRIISDQIGAPTSSKFLAEATLVVVSSVCNEEEIFSSWGTYHLSGNPQTSWYEFAKYIYAIYNAERNDGAITSVLPVFTKDMSYKACRPMFSVLDCSKFEKTFKIESEPWMTGIEEIIKMMKY